MSRTLGVGMAFGYAGGYAERRLAGAASSKAWARYTYMLYVRNPRWATSAASVGLHAGQEYGVPMGIGIGEETGESLAGDKVDSLSTSRP